jgi:hypothetical protein
MSGAPDRASPDAILTLATWVEAHRRCRLQVRQPKGGAIYLECAAHQQLYQLAGLPPLPPLTLTPDPRTPIADWAALHAACRLSYHAPRDDDPGFFACVRDGSMYVLGINACR